jgi:hypothetical protein
MFLDEFRTDLFKDLSDPRVLLGTHLHHYGDVMFLREVMRFLQGHHQITCLVRFVTGQGQHDRGIQILFKVFDPELQLVKTLSVGCIIN